MLRDNRGTDPALACHTCMTHCLRALGNLIWAIGLCVAAFTPAQAVTAGSVVLNTALKQHLLARERIVTPTSGGAALDNRVVVVSFFASWCPPCTTEFHALNELRKAFPDSELSIVAVNVFEAFDDNDAARMARFLATTTPQFDVVSGTAETRQRFGGIDRIPNVFVFDKLGEPVLHFIHRRGAQKMSVSAKEMRDAVISALER